MAKWGEGDPRWIVEERADATNVNNWHWTEKNADHWSKKKLEDLLIGHSPCDGVSIDAIDKCEGEARVNNRKAKLIFFYEWDIVLSWSGRSGDVKDIMGKITIPNLSEEHTDLADVDIDVSVTERKDTKEAQRLKDQLRGGAGAASLRSQLEKYVRALESEFSQGLILPANNSSGNLSSKASSQKSPAPSTTTSKSSEGKASPHAAMKNLNLSGCRLDVGNISLEENFKCTGQELYNVLSQREMIQVFTNDEVNLEKTVVGQKFELLGGNIKGEFVELTPFSKIGQKWRLRNWPDGHYSDVEFTISQGKDDTKLNILQKSVPSKEIDATRAGWKRYYLDAIKRSFGFGVDFF